MTATLEERLIILKTEINELNKENGDLDQMDKNFDSADVDLDLIEKYLGDLKNSAKLTVEEQEELFNNIGRSVEELETVIKLLKEKIHKLKLKQIEQNKKIKRIAGLCVGGGLIAGVSITLGWKALKAFIARYTPKPTP